MNFKERNESTNDRAPMMYEKIQSKFLTVVLKVPSVQGFHEMAKSFAQNLRYFRANFFCELLAIFAHETQ